LVRKTGKIGRKIELNDGVKIVCTFYVIRKPETERQFDGKRKNTRYPRGHFGSNDLFTSEGADTKGVIDEEPQVTDEELLDTDEEPAIETY